MAVLDEFLVRAATYASVCHVTVSIRVGLLGQVTDVHRSALRAARIDSSAAPT